MRFTTFLLSAALALISPSFIHADTAANCLYDDVAGIWNVTLSSAGHDNTIACQTNFIPASHQLVTLSYPNIATDEQGNMGTWTMIYNQGFEIRLKGVVYFAFSKFEQQPGASWSMSFCDQTSNGWFHDDQYTKAINWGCTSMTKTTPVPPRNSTVPSDAATFDDLSMRKYITDHKFVAAINSVQNLWTAKVYPEMHGQNLAHLQQRAGTIKQEGQVSGFQSYVEGIKVADIPEVDLDEIPAEYDWRNVSGVNYVSPVRNQGGCGSCYIFSSMGMLEARARIISKNKKQPILSTQQPLACSQYSQGCAGGFPYLIAGKFAHDFGIVEEHCYPYTGKDGTPCSYTCNGNTTHLWTSTNQYTYVGGYYGAVTPALMQQEILKNGPVSVSFEVYSDFQLYAGGIYTHKPIADAKIESFNPFYITNHAVLAVGWGVENGVKYWIVKNSWGASWGEQGYFRILREAGPGGECSIESLVASAIPLLGL